MLRAALLTIAACMTLAGVARADVLYTFVPNTYAGGWSGLSLSFQLSDAAAHGGTFTSQQLQLPFGQTGSAGLDSMSGIAPLLAVAMGDGKGTFSIGLTLNALGDILSSGFRFGENDGTQQAFLSGTGRHAEGAYSTDNSGSPCYVVGACTVNGHWTEREVPVPEPATLALLGGGLLALGAVRRRKP